MKTQRGFTLLELSIVMIILGIALVAAIQAYQIYDEKRKFETTELRLTDIQGAIEDFVETNGRLPCAAPRGVDRTDAKYGREEDCKTAPTGTVGVSGLNSQRVRIGMLPARTLGISDIYMQDAYGNSFVYAVTEGLTDETTYTHDGGGIDVLDNTGTSRLSAIDYAQFIIVSPGASGYGAYSYSGQLSVPCDTNRVEGENCDDDAIFMDTDLSRGDVANFYDDRAFYKSRLNVALQGSTPVCVQQETFTTFVEDGEDCPDGWQRVAGFPTNQVANGAVRASGQFLNIDEETGDYYFSQSKTAETTFGRAGGDFNALSSGKPTKKIVCEKSGSNTSQTKCFPKAVTVQASSLKSGTASAYGAIGPDDVKDYCPNGWKVVDYYRDQGTSIGPSPTYHEGSGSGHGSSSWGGELQQQSYDNGTVVSCAKRAESK